MVVVIGNEYINEIVDAIKTNTYLVEDESQIKAYNLVLNSSTYEDINNIFQIEEVKTVIMDSSSVEAIEYLQELDKNEKKLIFINHEYSLGQLYSNNIFEYVDYDKDTLAMKILDVCVKEITDEDIIRNLYDNIKNVEIIGISKDILTINKIDKLITKKGINVIDNYDSKFELFLDILNQNKEKVVIRSNDQAFDILYKMKFKVKYYVYKERNTYHKPIFSFKNKVERKQLIKDIKAL